MNIFCRLRLVAIHSLILVGILMHASLNLAGATPVKWTLRDVTFDDGGTATGFFVFDSDVLGQQFATEFDIETSGGGSTFGTFRYTPESTRFGRQNNHDDFDFFSAEGPCLPGVIDCVRAIQLVFDDGGNATNTGGVMSVRPENFSPGSREVLILVARNIFTRGVVGGELVGTSCPTCSGPTPVVPEPSAWFILAVGCAAVLISRQWARHVRSTTGYRRMRG